MAATKPLRADAERNRRKILDAASELFALKGVCVGLDEIAHHAGVGVATAYRRFPDKAQLVDALFEERADALVAAAEAGLAEEDPWQGVVTFMTGAVELHASDRAVKELVFEGSGSEARVAQIRSRMAPRVKEIVRRAQESGDLRADIAATDLILLQFMVASAGDLRMPELWRRGLDVVLDGLRGDRPLAGRALSDEEFAQAVAQSRR
jgi:AcrR family transcriptional regulator